MKNFKILPFLFLTLIFTVLACEKLQNLILVPLNISSDFVIPEQGGINDLLSISTNNVSTNIVAVLAAKDSEKDKVQSIILNELNLTIDASGRNFGFADTLEVYLVTDNQAEILIANKQGVDSTSITLSMDVLGNDVSSYLKEDEVSFITKWKNKRVDPSSTKINLTSKFEISSDIF